MAELGNALEPRNSAPVRELVLAGLVFGLRTTPPWAFDSDRSALFSVGFAGEYDHLLRRMRPGDVVLDAGANVGYFSLLASQRIEPDGFVVAVEPDPQNLEQLGWNLRRNSITNVRVIPNALSGGPRSRVRLSSHGVGSRVDSRGDVEVEAVPLGAALDAAGGSPPDLVKMDIEGTELEVLSDAEAQSRLRHARALTLEVHSPQALRVAQEVLPKLGFRISPLRAEAFGVPRVLLRLAFRSPAAIALYGPEVFRPLRRILNDQRAAALNASGASPFLRGTISAVRFP